MGETIQANIQREKPKWNLVRIQNFELVQTAYQLTQSKLHLPKCEAKELAVTELKNVGKRGLLSRDITGLAPRIRVDKPDQAKSRLPRGPFDLSESLPKPTDTYPTLWNHNAKKEIHLIYQSDRKLIVRQGMEDKANEIWHRFAGRCHFTQDHTLTCKRGKGASIAVEKRQDKLVAKGEVQKHCKRFVLHGTDVWQAVRCSCFPMLYHIIGDKIRTTPADAQ